MVNETAGERLARPGLVPVRRLHAAQRPADAAHQAGHRPLLRPRLLHPGLMPWRLRVRPRARVPRPSSTSSRRTGCSSTATFVDPADGEPFKTINPATEEVLAEVAEAGAGRRRPRGRGRPRARTTRSGARCPGRDRAKYLYRIARIIQERSRELAVLESLDNGKPIRESRDVDLPLVAAHFFYYAGWADKLAYAGFGAEPAAARRGRPGHPVELPAAHAGLEDRAGAGRRQHGGAQAGRDHAADRAAVRRDLPAGRPAAGRGQHRHRRRRDRPAAWSSTRASTRSRSPAPPRSAGRSPGRSPAPARRLTLELGGKAANIVFDDAPIDQAVEGIVNGIFFNQGHVCCAGSRLLVQESVADEVLGVAEAADGDAAGRRPAGQEHRHRRDQLGRPAGPHPRAVRGRRGRGRRALVAAVRAARPGLLVRADHLHRRLPGAPDRPRGDLRAGAVGADVPHARPRRSRRPTTRRTGCRPASGPRRARASSPMADQLRAGVVWANTFNKFDPASPFGGYKESGYGREGGRHGLEAYLALIRARLAVRKTYKLFIGGAFPRSESGRSYPVRSATATSWRTRRWPPARTSATRCGPPGRRSAAGPARPRTTAARSSTGSPRCWRAGGTEFVALGVAGGRGGRRDRPLGLVRRLGRQDRPGVRRRQPGRRAVLQPLRARADRRGRRRRARRLGAARPGQRDRPGDRHRQHRGGAGQRGAPAAGGHAGRGAGHLRPARRGGQPAHRPRRRDRAVAGRRTWTSTRST